MNYYKYKWNKKTGEDLTGTWGTSTYYYEVEIEGYVARQIEVFENGHVLKYDSDFKEDKYGFLTDQPIGNSEITVLEKISEEDFNNIWKTTNRYI